MESENIIHPLDKFNGKLFPVWTVHYFRKYILSEVEDNPQKKNEIKKYQEFVYSILNSSFFFRNVLIYHDLGSGKTVTAINIMNMMYSQKECNIIILLPASLKDSSWNTALKVWAKDAVRKNIHFVSFNSSTFEKKFTEINNILDNRIPKLYFIDECHNFIHNVYTNMITDKTSGSISVYNTLINDQNVSNTSRVIALSATPILTHPFEYALLFNLLRKNCLPTKISQFNDLFINTNVDNRNMFMRRILGLVSFYKNTDTKNFPSIKIHKKYVKMSKYQHRVYSFFESKEFEKEKEKKFSFKISTRLASNFVFPDIKNKNVYGEKRPYSQNMSGTTDDKQKKMMDTYKLELKKFVKLQVKEKDVENDFKQMSNQLDFNESTKVSPSLDILYMMSCKMTEILFNVYKQKGKHVIYSNFVHNEGLEFMKLYLDVMNISYLEFHGDIDFKVRSMILEKFNQKNNVAGEKYKVLLLSSAGLEGISLMCVRFVHILEPSWNDVSEKQLIGRSARMNSHNLLPEESRNVTVLKYLAYNKNTSGNIVDIYIARTSETNETLKNEFNNLVKRSAIDCELFKKNNMKNEKYECFQFSQDTYLKNINDNMTPVGPTNSVHYNNYSNDGLFATSSEMKKIEVRMINLFTGKNIIRAWLDENTGIVYDIDFETIPIGIVIKNEFGFFKRYDRETYMLEKTYNFIS